MLRVYSGCFFLVSWGVFKCQFCFHLVFFPRGAYQLFCAVPVTVVTAETRDRVAHEKITCVTLFCLERTRIRSSPVSVGVLSTPRLFCSM